MSSEQNLYSLVAIDDDSCGPMDPPAHPRSGSVKRMSNYVAHKEYQAMTSDPSSPSFINKITSGPLLCEDGSSMIGSCFILKATRAEVENFYKSDPFYSAGVWKTVICERYWSFNGIKETPPSS